MKKNDQSLPTDVDALQQMVMHLQQQLSDTEQKHQRLLEQFRLAQNKRFGANSEGHPGQGELFNEAESLVEETDTESQDNTTTVTYERKQSKRQQLPKDLPRERIVHDIEDEDEDKVCECCAGALHHMGDDISEKLKFIPAQVKVVEHVRPKYACKACENNGTSNQIKQVPMPSAIIPKGYATPSLLAQVITSKYQYGLPLSVRLPVVFNF